MTLRLVPSSGRSIEITRDRVVVGRDPTCEVVVNDPSISRRHARLEHRDDGWAVMDEGSANGTFVDSKRVSSARLTHGQELRLGTAGFRVEIVTATRDAAPPSVTVFEEIPLAAPPRRPRRAGGGSARPSRPARRAGPKWVAGGAVVLLAAGATAGVLLFGSGGSDTAPATPPVGSLGARTLGVTEASSVVTIRLEISGVACRPEPGGYRIDLVADLATFGPDGEPIPELTHREFQRLSQVLAGEERTATLTATVSPPAGGQRGGHRARFTVRDLVANTELVHEVPFERR